MNGHFQTDTFQTDTFRKGEEMAAVAQGNRLSPGSVLALTVIAGLLLGLVALCCCAGEHPAAHAVDHASVVLSDPGTDSPVDTGAARSGDGCDRPAEHPDAIVASVTVITRDLVAVVASGPPRTDDGAVRTLVDGGSGARAPAPAARLLCIMRT